jgi:hypothetical protein
MCIICARKWRDRSVSTSQSAELVLIESTKLHQSLRHDPNAVHVTSLWTAAQQFRGAMANKSSPNGNKDRSPHISAPATPEPPGGTTLSADHAVQEVIAATPIACQEINKFSQRVFKTRGGRMGSGMGLLLEGLWGYYVDQGRPAREAGNEGWEIGWLSDHEYNDFACIQCDMPWIPATNEGEFFRIEAKSMNSAADESRSNASASAL